MPRPKGSTNNTGGQGEPIATYFRQIFENNRKLLKTRSNKQVLAMWLADHPEFPEVPENVKTGLANIKSSMRSKIRRGRPRKDASNQLAAASIGVLAKPKKKISEAGLEKLEIMIDECMIFAREIGRDELDNILRALRVARRQVVMMATDE